jgi:hypothetical protein
VPNSEIKDAKPDKLIQIAIEAQLKEAQAITEMDIKNAAIQKKKNSEALQLLNNLNDKSLLSTMEALKTSQAQVLTSFPTL